MVGQAIEILEKEMRSREEKCRTEGYPKLRAFQREICFR
jgi:hypothetical protein